MGKILKIGGIGVQTIKKALEKVYYIQAISGCGGLSCPPHLVKIVYLGY